MEESKKFDMATCETNEKGEVVCEEMPYPDYEDSEITVAEKTEAPEAITEKKPRPPEDVKIV